MRGYRKHKTIDYILHKQVTEMSPDQSSKLSWKYLANRYLYINCNQCQLSQEELKSLYESIPNHLINKWTLTAPLHAHANIDNLILLINKGYNQYMNSLIRIIFARGKYLPNPEKYLIDLIKRNNKVDTGNRKSLAYFIYLEHINDEKLVKLLQTIYHINKKCFKIIFSDTDISKLQNTKPKTYTYLLSIKQEIEQIFANNNKTDATDSDSDTQSNHNGTSLHKTNQQTANNTWSNQQPFASYMSTAISHATSHTNSSNLFIGSSTKKKQFLNDDDDSE
ncbi:MAG: hypothetical protein CL947_01760 [Epsilonproteobacteria bacterium]|nr:hypothetical protein [Campylobacterota bacterium]|tara:strand:- start:3908 stop:4744 length:837 start_codon:yes stop_codon:yes gene_type:complete